MDTQNYQFLKALPFPSQPFWHIQYISISNLQGVFHHWYRGETFGVWKDEEFQMRSSLEPLKKVHGVHLESTKYYHQHLLNHQHCYNSFTNLVYIYIYLIWYMGAVENSFIILSWYDPLRFALARSCARKDFSILHPSHAESQGLLYFNLVFKIFSLNHNRDARN